MILVLLQILVEFVSVFSDSSILLTFGSIYLSINVLKISIYIFIYLHWYLYLYMSICITTYVHRKHMHVCVYTYIYDFLTSTLFTLILVSIWVLLEADINGIRQSRKLMGKTSEKNEGQRAGGGRKDFTVEHKSGAVRWEREGREIWWKGSQELVGSWESWEFDHDYWGEGFRAQVSHLRSSVNMQIGTSLVPFPCWLCWEEPEGSVALCFLWWRIQQVSARTANPMAISLEAELRSPFEWLLQYYTSS